MAREKSGTTGTALGKMRGDAGDGCLVSYFHGRVLLACEDQGVRLAPATSRYLAGVMAGAAGPPRETLAELRAQALAAPSRDAAGSWRQLGESALLVGGVFVGALARRNVSRAYCVAMGVSAYGVLGATACEGDARAVYGGLADEFGPVADVLAEVGDTETSDAVVRVYRAWRATGSERLAARLRGWGIALPPVDATD